LKFRWQKTSAASAPRGERINTNTAITGEDRHPLIKIQNTELQKQKTLLWKTPVIPSPKRKHSRIFKNSQENSRKFKKIQEIFPIRSVLQNTKYKIQKPKDCAFQENKPLLRLYFQKNYLTVKSYPQS